MYKANGPPIIIPKVPAKNIIIALLPSFFNAAKLILKVSVLNSQVISNETQWCIGRLSRYDVKGVEKCRNKIA
jgi:hypothetical protein